LLCRLEYESESLVGIEALKLQKVPGIYYSTGTAACGDLNFTDNAFAIPVHRLSDNSILG